MRDDSKPGPHPPVAVTNAFDDIFGAFAAHFAEQQRSSGDLRTDVSVTIEDAAYGCQRDVTLRRRHICATCEGSGAEPGSELVSCRRCGARGRLQSTAGHFTQVTQCPACNGRGAWPLHTCDACDAGTVTTQETVSVTVPPGVTDGHVLRIEQQGDERARGTFGDLHVGIRIAGEDMARYRKGDDVEIEVAVSARQYLVGGIVEVPTMAASAQVRIPWLPRDGTIVTLPELGFRKARGVYRGDVGRGEQRVILRVSRETRRAAIGMALTFAAVVGLLLLLAIF